MYFWCFEIAVKPPMCEALSNDLLFCCRMGSVQRWLRRRLHDMGIKNSWL
jgi:hypothetical protein